MNAKEPSATKVADLAAQWSQSDRARTPTSVDALSLRAGLTVARFSTADLLLDVDGGATLEQARDAAKANGAFFPMLAAPSDRSIAALVATHPLLVDGFVSHVDAIDLHGREVSTPAAPRSAQGPDLLGALLCHPPLALCARARVRCASMTTMSKFRLRAPDAAAAAAAVLLLVREAHAFSVTASGKEVVVIGKEVPIALRHLVTDGESDEDAEAATGGSMLAPFHLDPILAALEEGAVITAAPQMGRVSRTTSSTSVPLLAADAAAKAIHSALVQGAQESQW